MNVYSFALIITYEYLFMYAWCSLLLWNDEQDATQFKAEFQNGTAVLGLIEKHE